MLNVGCFCGKKINKLHKLVDVIHSFCESKSLMNFTKFAGLNWSVWVYSRDQSAVLTLKNSYTLVYLNKWIYTMFM